jgi:hypothetical protein
MSEFSYWWTTSGTPSGDQVASYTQAHLARIAAVLAACSGFEGVAPGYLNSLAGTVTGANTVQINTGGAVVDGKVYDSDSAVNVNIPSASGGGNTRIDRIVLRVSWSAFTVRITRIAGTDAASPAAPAITQTSGTTYDITLYQALVNTSGTVTLTDERTVASLFTHRQGADATDWEEEGATTYIPANMRIQMGVAVVGVLAGGADSGNIDVTFPIPFGGTNAPLVVGSPFSALSSNAHFSYGIASSQATKFTVRVYNNSASSFEVNFSWIAIGPR